MTAHIQVLAAPDDVDRVIEACFSETTTLGLRSQIIERRILERGHATVDVDGRSVRVKTAQRASGVTAKAESDDLRNVPGGRAEREGVRQLAEQMSSRGGSKK
jgi:uncharacterized protein (DUF111 family)